MYPFINIFGFKIASYGLCMALACVLVFVLSVRKGKRCGIMAEDILITGVTAIGVGVVCAKLLYILVTYSFGEIAAMLAAGDFSFIVNDGLVFYGGLIGGIVGAFIGAHISGVKVYKLEPIIAPYLPLGHAIGRIGCVLAGCCYGMRYDGFGAIYYPNTVFDFPQGVGFFPVQLVEAFCLVTISVALVHYAKKPRGKYSILFMYLGLYSIVRFCTEFVRGDAIRGIYFTISTSQWISIGLLAICVLRAVVIKLKSRD